MSCTITGAVQTAVAITLLTTAAGQTTLLSPGNEGLCKAFRILRPAILVLTLVLMVRIKALLIVFSVHSLQTL